jgi:hypothetical protein
MLMPNEAMLVQFTLRMVRVVSRLAKHHTQAEIAKLLDLSPRIVAGEVLGAETITSCAVVTPNCGLGPRPAGLAGDVH